MPWELLADAARRGTHVVLVLDRVDPGTETAVGDHLRQMLADAGLATATVIVVPEVELEDGLLPEAAIGPIAASGSSPSSSSTSGTTMTVAEASPASMSICRRWSPTAVSAPGSTRSSTSARCVPRRAASASSSQGTASAYRAAVVTNSHTSAAPSNWAASTRLPSSTESTSGASSSARPTGTASDATSRSPGRAPVSPSSPAASARLRDGSTRSELNHRTSNGWCTSTGQRVVGRSTPDGLTSAPTNELTTVDLPAPVEPPTTTSTGAPGSRSLGRR